jgi:nucleotide-binding universal stress UspA family protein
MTDFPRILCAVDFSPHSAHTVAHALALAGWYKARLTLLHVYWNRAVMDVPPVPLTLADRENLHARLRALVGTPPAGVEVEYRVEEASDIGRALLADTAGGADLLVIGRHGHSAVQTFLLGSVAERVLREAACPVMVVPERDPGVDPAAPPRFGRILCPVDFSDASVHALAVALTLAQEASAHLLVLHVVEPRPHGEDVAMLAAVERMEIQEAAEADALQRLRMLIPSDARTYCSIATQVRHGRAHREILAAILEDCSELVVIGVRSRGAVNRMLFGSTTAPVVRGAECPVLTIPRAR